ncbi:hypothetical protein VU14_04880 [Aeromonas hydrophila]|nr:hypothetical protein VU14_04880 [Aeromonas hydrophila]
MRRSFAQPCVWPRLESGSGSKILHLQVKSGPGSASIDRDKRARGFPLTSTARTYAIRRPYVVQPQA